MVIEQHEQFTRAIDLMENTHRSVFLTGKAGTGKSTLLSYFMKHTKKNVVVLAPTGVAALNVQGETIHSFFGFMPNMSVDKAKKKGAKATKNELYTLLTTIIIDEVSMVRADLMDCVDQFLKAARKNKEPFGGVQMIFIGDLYQLPPIAMTHEKDFFEEFYQSPWFFHSKAVTDERFFMDLVELDKIYRQSDDDFIELLNAIRVNTITDRQINAINMRVLTGSSEHDDSIHLTSTNQLAADINDARLAQLKTPACNFTSTIKGNFDMKQYPTDQALTLKVGAQVMFANNDMYGQWVNGTVGQVTEILSRAVIVKIHGGKEVHVTPHEWKLYRYEYDSSSKSLSQKSAGAFEQIPLKLAWAITIHKSQGKTFDKVVIDLGNGSFASGQTYVALSRCRTFEGIRLKKPIRKSDVRVDRQVHRFLTEYQRETFERI